MGVLDKIKNALFEVEYVEVEEPPKKEKKVKKEKKEKNEEKPIAKKIVLPGTRVEKVKELQEEELKDEDFEIRPKEEPIREKSHEDFKIMDDNDFKMDDDFQEQPEILRNIEDTPIFEEQSRVSRRSNSEERQKEYYPEEVQEDFYQEKIVDTGYSNPSRETSFTHHESKLYGRDNSYDVPVHKYGTYEKKEEKVYFKPSPIISPIYGILDKNYKKEDVREKKEVRITSNYTRSNVSVDDIRNKAYGTRNSQEQEILENVFEDNAKFEVEEDDDNLLVDLSDHKKPEVKELTVGDALEYFQDLGLEYNVDYVDVSKEKASPKHVQNSSKEKLVNPLEKEIMDGNEQNVKSSKDRKMIEVKDESLQTGTVGSSSDNDNLFDLIDSMYQEND